VKVILLIIFVFPSSLFATSIIATRSPSGFMIATDSKVVYRGAGIKGTETVCKVYRSGDLYFAVAGMPADRNRNYYPTKLVGQNYKEIDSFEANITRIEQSISTAIIDEMRKLRTETPDQFMQNQDGETLEIVFARIANGVPELAGRGFKYVDGDNPRVEIARMTCPGDCPNGTYVVFAGHQQEMRKITNFVFEHPEAPITPAEFGQMAIEAEINASKDEVGPPVTILIVTTQGVDWTSNKVGCPVVEPTQ
jgi:hypothetical protein